MSFWFSARPLQSPYSVRRSPAASAKYVLQGPDTITVCSFMIKRRTPSPYVSVVDEVANLLEKKVTGLVRGESMFPNRIPQENADDANVALLIDSMTSVPPRGYVGKAASHEYPRIQLIGASRDEYHHEEAVRLVHDSFTVLSTTFTTEVGA